jgi:hypothetical protein
MGWNRSSTAPVDFARTGARGHACCLPAIINKELGGGRKGKKKIDKKKKKKNIGSEGAKAYRRGLQREDAKRCGSDHQFSQHFIDRLGAIELLVGVSSERSPPFIMTTRTSVGFHRTWNQGGNKKKREKIVRIARMPMMRKSAMLDTHTRIIETRGIKGL